MATATVSSATHTHFFASYDYKNMIRVPKWCAERLMWERRVFYVCHDHCEPRPYPTPNFCRFDGAELAKIAVEQMKETMKNISNKIEFYDTEERDFSKWPVIASMGIKIAIRATLNGSFARLHYYYEHPAEVQEKPVLGAIDYTKEQDGFDDKPYGPLCVLHRPAFAPPGLGLRVWGEIVKSLPHWTVKVPVSLIQPATSPPGITINTRGTEKRLIGDVAIRMIDFKTICEFLKIPPYIYARAVSPRHTPKEYRREQESRPEGSLDYRRR